MVNHTESQHNTKQHIKSLQTKIAKRTLTRIFKVLNLKFLLRKWKKRNLN